MISPEFLLTSLIVVLIPGTGTLYTVSTGLFYGVRASFAAALGCMLGIVPHLLASILGLSLILHTSATLFSGLKWLGVGYLLYLAWMMWRDDSGLAFSAASSERSPWRIVSKAVLLQHPQPQADTLLFRLPAALALTQCPLAPARAPDPEPRLHGDDASHLRALRRPGEQRSPHRRQLTQSYALAPEELRSGVRRPRAEARTDKTVAQSPTPSGDFHETLALSPNTGFMAQLSIPRWQNRLGTLLMGLAAAGALFTFIGSAQTLPLAHPDTLWLNLWRATGFLMFAGMFALLALRPRRSPGLWELAFFHKAAMALAALYLGDIPEATAAGWVDGALALMLAAAYGLTRGWRSWRT